MPPTWVKDEGKWSKAKDVVREQYPDVDADSDRFYALVAGVYKQSGGEMEKSLRCEQCHTPLMKAGDDGALLLKSRVLVLTAGGELQHVCPRCKGTSPVPDAFVKALLSHARLTVRLPRRS